MTAPVRVLVYARVPDGDPGAVERAYHEISRALDGTPGLLGNELLRSVHDPGSLAVLSHWENRDAFDTWERGSGHKPATAPLRPLQDRAKGFGIYEVIGTYGPVPG